jgi:hypothetical protein
MARHSPYSDPLDAAVAALGALTPHGPDDLKDIEQAIIGIVRVRARRTPAPAAPKSRREVREAKFTRDTPAQTQVVAMTKDSPFYGLGLREAGPKQLTIAGKPQLPREIWEALKAAGFQTAHGDPVSAMRSAMNRREATHGDVFLVGEGKWGRKEWYSEEELLLIKKSVGGMGGRDRAAHSDRTINGMLVARARGAKPGQPTKLPPEKIIELERMISEGKKVSEVARHFDIQPQTIYSRYKRKDLEALRARHEECSNDSGTRQLRVVK